MAVTIIIGEGEGERRFDVAPYKLKQLRQIAPFVEAMNDVAKRIKKAQEAAEAAGEKYQQNLDDLFLLSRQLCEIIAIGICKIDPAMNADAIEDATDLSALASLQTAVRALLEQSGLSSKGEGTAPSPTAGQQGAEAEVATEALASS